jgi:hypothetical protein
MDKAEVGAGIITVVASGEDAITTVRAPSM